MKITLTLLATLLLATIYTSAQTKTIPYQELKSSSGATSGSGIFFGASMTADSITVTFAGPSTKWIGLGFGKNMGGSDALIYTSSGGTQDWWDYFMGSTSSNSVVKDAQQDWKFKSNTDVNNLRTVVATRKLNTNDANDAVINFNSSTLNLIWAKGSGSSYALANHGGGNRAFGISLAWVIPDVTAPQLTSNPFTPSDNATNIATNTAVNVNFNEAVVPDKGLISIYNANNTLFYATDAASNSVVFNGSQLTVTPSKMLEDSTEYYVLISSDAIKDLSGNFYTGISSPTEWNFTTAAAKQSASLFEVSKSKIIQTKEKSILIRANESSYNYQIIDLQGNILKFKNDVQVDTYIDFTEFKPAVYFITFSDGYQTINHKFVVQ